MFTALFYSRATDVIHACPADPERKMVK